MEVDERQTVHTGSHQVARVLTTHSSGVGQRRCHECLRRVLVGHATLAGIALPLAPRSRSTRIVHAEEEVIVTLDEDGGREVGDGLLKWCLADITRELEHDALAQVTAQGGAVGIPQFQGAAARAPVAAAAVDESTQDGLQIRAQRIIERVLFRPCRAASVLGGVEAQGQAGGHATTLTVFVKQGIDNRARIGRIKWPFALVVAIGDEV